MTNTPLRHPLDCNFLVIAHRGARQQAPENTMAAFKAALQMEADMIELDVQLSKDGVPVVFHDSKLERHSNGKGQISSFLFDELQQLDAGKWFSTEFIGEKIPSLKQVVEWAAGKIMLNIEIKPEAVDDSIQDGVEEKVVELVHSVGMIKNVIISSFDYRAVERTKKIEPQIATGLLYSHKASNKKDPIELLDKYGADLFHCGKGEMSKEWIRQLEDNGKRFLIYTVNGKKKMRNWIGKGAFGIFSDRPERLKEVADEFFSKTA